MKTVFIPGKLYESEKTGVVVRCTDGKPGWISFQGTVEISDGNRPIGFFSRNWDKDRFKLYTGNLLDDLDIDHGEDEPINEPELKVLL